MIDFSRTNDIRLAELQVEILQRMTGEPCRITRTAGEYRVNRSERGRGKYSVYEWERWKVGDGMYCPNHLTHQLVTRALTWRKYKPEREQIRFRQQKVDDEFTWFWRAA